MRRIVISKNCSSQHMGDFHKYREIYSRWDFHNQCELRRANETHNCKVHCKLFTICSHNVLCRPQSATQSCYKTSQLQQRSHLSQDSVVSTGLQPATSWLRICVDWYCNAMDVLSNWYGMVHYCQWALTVVLYCYRKQYYLQASLLVVSIFLGSVCVFSTLCAILELWKLQAELYVVLSSWYSSVENNEENGALPTTAWKKAQQESGGVPSQCPENERMAINKGQPENNEHYVQGEPEFGPENRRKWASMIWRKIAVDLLHWCLLHWCLLHWRSQFCLRKILDLRSPHDPTVSSRLLVAS